MGRHCNNPQCFVRKATVFSPHDLALLYKDNFRKNNNNNNNNKNQVGKHYSNPQCLKKITKLNSQPTQY